MSIKVFSDICLHLIWHTKRSLPLITPDIEGRLYRFLKHRIAQTAGAFCHEVGGVENHIHAAVNIPPTLTISDWIGELKRSSSHHINHLGRHRLPRLAWQQGYGVVSVSKKDLPFVINYIRNQKEHHRSGRLVSTLERIDPETCG